MLACTKELVRLLRRIAVTVVGTVILAVGVVLLLAAPGPGLMVIALALVGVRRRVSMGQTPAGCRPGTGALGCSACTVLLGVGGIGLGAVLIFTGVLPSSGAGTGAGVAAGRLTVLAAMA